ncbi:LysR substrate-binding domain-containing protein [Paraburkholderia sp. D15]|uniref:LysR substrate-binding domain-containing protein n=1 Tax=Paraburkholderia sp. D15 TaxID=2880218 RepID=UPI002478F2D7|nr:LysR substrate-binding domain-containing protein [Paraburkholderia sp. D15]WGS52612.1 LysR substrate-binding domain-containing protein [Paraburkholderia sp. D15]
MNRINLDMDVLRTLVTAQQLGSFNRAAGRLGRSQSAVSQQLRKIEELVGEALFQKQGRGLALTAAGDVMLAYARRILELNDEAVAAVRGFAIDGLVRIGFPADFAETWLPTVLGRFKRAHPAVRIEAVVEGNRRLLEKLDKGELDLVLSLGQEARADAEPVGTVDLVWIGPAEPERSWRSDGNEPLPLVLFDTPCFFRQRALEALDKAGRPWRIAFTSPSLPGLWAAVEAGLGVTLRTATGLPERLQVVGDALALPTVRAPVLQVSMHDGARGLEPAVRRLKDIIAETIAAHLPAAVALAPLS